MGGGECPRGEHDGPAPMNRDLARHGVRRRDARHPPSLGVQASHHCVGAELEPAPDKGLDHDGGEIVLGAHSAGKAVTRAASHAGGASRTRRVIDRERQTEWMAAQVASRPCDTL